MSTTKKVIKVEENVRSYESKMGKAYIHRITLGEPVEGQVEWEYHSKSPTVSPDKFTAGKDASFTTEIKQNGNYTNYKIKPELAAAPVGSGFRKGEQRDEGRISALSSVSTAVNFYAQRSNVKEEDVLAFAEKIYAWAASKSLK